MICDTNWLLFTALSLFTLKVDAQESSSSTGASSSSSSSSNASSESSSAGSTSELVGTWSSKSNTVFTGPGFYDPIDELLIEPALPGISYSFTEDGYWEEAVYQITSNAQNHSCPAAALTFQHGTYEILSNGSLLLTPFEVDGRQLLSEPCEDYGISTYSRYVQTELYAQFSVYVDPYHGRYRLNLFEWDGTPVQPLYLAYRPPMMLPTETLNPTDTAAETHSLRKRIRRSLANKGRTRAVKVSPINVDLWWWTSVGVIAVGGVSYFFL